MCEWSAFHLRMLFSLVRLLRETHQEAGFSEATALGLGLPRRDCRALPRPLGLFHTSVPAASLSLDLSCVA